MAAITAHGTKIEHAPNGVGWTEIGEVGDFTLPGVTRNEFDATAHNRDIDSYVMGVLRREPVTFPVFWNKADASQVALRSSIISNTLDGFRLTFPDGDVWIGSGYVRAVAQTAPVDGLLAANVTLRLSGKMYLNGTLIG